MKKLSKVLSVICALVLVASLGVTAFAVDVGGESGSPSLDSEAKSVDVNAKAKAGSGKVSTYKISIVSDPLEFEYVGDVGGTWNVTNLKWDGAAEAHWLAEDKTIALTNYSDKAITASAQVTKETAYEGLTVTCDSSVDLETADNSQGESGAGKATTGSIKVHVDGDPTSLSLPESATKIANVTITLTEKV